MVQYNLVKDNEYYHLKTNNKKAIVKELRIFGFGDIVETSVAKKDFEYRSGFPTYRLKIKSKKLECYDRFNEIPRDQLNYLADVIVKDLHISIFKKKQVLEELLTLQNVQNQLIKEDKLRFPKISDKEMNFASLW